MRDGRRPDGWFVELVEALDASVAAVDGRREGVGFVETPVVDGSPLATEAQLPHGVELWIKDETGQVGGSHKARHLFGVALQLLVDEELGAPPAAQLAIASCGNAALAAGVVAAALQRQLTVFVPTWAEPSIVDRLDDLGAEVVRCPRREGEAGDPAYLRFREAVDGGAFAFGVQGTETPTTFDGGRTLGWELADQVPGIDAVYVQVGGGALATSVAMAMPEALLYPVQAEGCAPLRRAWDRVAEDGFDFEAAAASPADYMWPWETEPASAATGILDDVTYDWLPLLARTHAAGGEPVVVPERTVLRAHELARAHTAIPVSPTGTAGFAGLLHHPPPVHRRVAVLFTGRAR